MNADHMIDWFLLERYLTGTITPAERTQIEQWIAADTDRQETVRRVQAALQTRGHRERRDWHRSDAIETVLTRVRAGRPTPAITVLPRRPSSKGSSAVARAVGTLRYWFEGATELAAAMLLDANEQPFSEEETKTLRDQINSRQRGHDER